MLLTAIYICDTNIRLFRKQLLVAIVKKKYLCTRIKEIAANSRK